MSDSDDLEGVAQPHISGEDAERLLSGAPGFDETGDLADVSAVFRALRRPADASELAGLQSALAAFSMADVTTQTDPSIARNRPMIKKRLTGKALATIGVVTFISAGAAAAAGVVPTPFSSSKPSTEVGTTDATDGLDNTVVTDSIVDTTPSTDVEAARLADDADSTVDTEGTEDTDGIGPDVNGPAKFGLCTAFHARTKHDTTDTTPAESSSTSSTDVPTTDDADQPPPFQNLSDAAEAAGQTVDEFCADATPGGSADAPGHSGDNPSATAPGHADDNPSGTAPGHNNTNPSGTAPGHSGGNGNGHQPGTTQP